MPLVKGIQQKFGADKLQVLMLSVDRSYGMSEKEVSKDNQKKLGSMGVAWTNIVLPNGFDDVQKRFNLDGYGLTLIGPDGIVRGVDIHGEELEPLLKKIYSG